MGNPLFVSFLLFAIAAEWLVMNFCESMFVIRSKGYTSGLNLNKTAESSHFLLKLKKKKKTTRKASV